MDTWGRSKGGQRRRRTERICERECRLGSLQEGVEPEVSLVYPLRFAPATGGEDEGEVEG